MNTLPMFTRVMSRDGHVTLLEHGYIENIRIDGKTPALLKGKKIIDVNFSKNFIIIITDTPELHQPLSWDIKTPMKETNLLALSTMGELVWRIEDILGEICYPFSLGFMISEREFEHYEKVFRTHFKRKHEYYVALSMSVGYLIDLTDMKFISREGFK